MGLWPSAAMAAAPLPSIRAPSGRPSLVVSRAGRGGGSGCSRWDVQTQPPRPRSAALARDPLHMPPLPGLRVSDCGTDRNTPECLRQTGRGAWASKAMGLGRELGTRLGSFEGHSEDLKCPQGQGAKAMPEQGILRKLAGPWWRGRGRLAWAAGPWREADRAGVWSRVAVQHPSAGRRALATLLPPSRTWRVVAPSRSPPLASWNSRTPLPRAQGAPSRERDLEESWPSPWGHYF